MSAAQRFTSKLQGKKVLILGGSSGIGLAVAQTCVESGLDVVISSSRPARVDSAITSIQQSSPSASDHIRGYTCDLSTPDVEQNLRNLFEKVGRVDHIVFTAGDSLPLMPLEDVTLNKIYAGGQVRTFAALLTAKVGSQYLSKSNTSSLIFSSGSIAERPVPGGWSIAALFCAGLYGLTRQLAFDLAPIRVNCVVPGVVDTDIWSTIPQEQRQAFFESHVAKMPTGEMGKAEEVAEAYLYLLRDNNATGSVVHSNSGGLLV